MEDMTGVLEVPYKELIANDDRASAISGIAVKILVLDNDSIPADCSPKLEIVPGQEPKHGSYSIILNDTVRYTSYDGYAGYDSLKYQISCNGDTATAYLYIYVAEKPDNIDDADCYTDPQSDVWSIREVSTSGLFNDFSTLQTPLIGDIDGDGKPEIIMTNATGAQVASTLYIVSGDLSTQKSAPISGNYTGVNALAGVARVKLQDGSHKVRIFVLSNSTYKLYAYDSVGNIEWTSNSNYTSGTTNGDGAALQIADLDSDGWSEILVGNRIFAAESGVLLCSTGASNEGVVHGWSTGNLLLQTVAGDVLGNGKQQVFIGNTMYSVTIKDRTGSVGNSMTPVKSITPEVCDAGSKVTLTATDGATQLADFDLDGNIDVVVSTITDRETLSASSKLRLYIWSPSKNKIIASKTIPYVYKRSVPFIGDIDGDGYPEIVVIRGGAAGNAANAESDWITALKYNPASATGEMDIFWELVHNDISGATGITLFDFNQDGISELIYRDNKNLRIINGSKKHHITGDPAVVYDLTTVLCGSATCYEYPVVADIDGDGQAEIITSGSLNGSSDVFAPLRIFKAGAGQKWASARKVWNQYSYNAININEDLTVPRYPMSLATVFPGKDGQLGTSDDVRPYNNFLQQQTALSTQGISLWLIPDAKFAETPVFNYYGYGDSLVISMELTNIGDAALQSTFYVSAYKNTVETAGKMAVDSSMTSLNVDDMVSFTLTVRNLSSHLPLNKIIIRINDRGAAVHVQVECDSANNMYEYPVDKLLMTFNDTVSMLSGSDTTVNVKLNDLIPDYCSAAVPTIAPDATKGIATIAHDSIKYVPNTDFYGVDSLVYHLTCKSNDTVSNAEAKMYIIVSKPVADSYIGCEGSTVEAGFKHIDDVEYHWYASETGSASSHVGDKHECTAPDEWWVEVRYMGNVVKSRLKVVIDAYPELTAGSIAADQTVCYGGTPDELISLTDADGGDGTPDYQWQDSTGTPGWQNIAGATLAKYTPGALTKTTKFRRVASNGCGTVYSESVTVTVYPESMFNYPDIRVRICPDPDPDKSVNLSKYVDTISLKTIEWTNVLPYIPISDIVSGEISTSDLKAHTVYTFTYTVSNACATDVKRKLYLETLRPGRMRPLMDTITICYEYAEAIQLNQIFGIEAGGEWSFSADDDAVDVIPYIMESFSTTHKGAMVMNGKAIYIDNAVADEPYHVVVTYTPAPGSCLDGKTYSIVIVLTPRI
jgi:hypothetical protein